MKYLALLLISTGELPAAQLVITSNGTYDFSSLIPGASIEFYEHGQAMDFTVRGPAVNVAAESEFRFTTAQYDGFFKVQLIDDPYEDRIVMTGTVQPLVQRVPEWQPALSPLVQVGGTISGRQSPAGSSDISSGHRHYSYFRDGQNPLNGLYIYDIYSSGVFAHRKQWTGEMIDWTGYVYAHRDSFVPEPSTCVFLSSGLLAIGFCQRIRCAARLKRAES